MSNKAGGGRRAAGAGRRAQPGSNPEFAGTIQGALVLRATLFNTALNGSHVEGNAQANADGLRASCSFEHRWRTLALLQALCRILRTLLVSAGIGGTNTDEADRSAPGLFCNRDLAPMHSAPKLQNNITLTGQLSQQQSVACTPSSFVQRHKITFDCRQPGRHVG